MHHPGLLFSTVRDQSPIKRKEGVLVFAGEPAEDLEEAVARNREREGVHLFPRGKNR